MPLTAEVRPCFAAARISVGLFAVPGAVFGIPVLVGVLAAFDFVLLLFTSVYGFSAIVRARNRRFLTSGSTAALIVLHALFVADVIAVIVLYVKIRKATKDTLAGAIGAQAE